MNIIDKINASQVITPDCAKLILRVSLGIFVLLHGVAKLTNPQAFGFVEGAVTGMGLPAFIAYFVYLGEIIAPIMLIIGYQTKVAALLVAILMVVAILLVHTGQLFSLGQSGGYALELQFMFLFAALAVFGLGAGKHTLLKK